MELNDISGTVIECSVDIHRELGPGLMESVYHRILTYEPRKRKFRVESEVPIPVEWDGHVIDESFRADMIVNERLLVELKSIEQTKPVHRKQTLTYLKLTGLRLALLINFGQELLKEGIHRLVNDLE
tara:strand:+ start:114 stop:494 length:381 start_codon:yes stop_codon:yes gene_type:complete